MVQWRRRALSCDAQATKVAKWSVTIVSSMEISPTRISPSTPTPPAVTSPAAPPSGRTPREASQRDRGPRREGDEDGIEIGTALEESLGHYAHLGTIAGGAAPGQDLLIECKEENEPLVSKCDAEFHLGQILGFGIGRTTNLAQHCDCEQQ